MVSVGYGAGEVAVRAGETREQVVETPDAGFPYYDSFLHVIALRSRSGASRGQTPASCGAFVEIATAERRP